MARKKLSSINLAQNELQNAVIQRLAAAPASPTDGQIYYNTTDDSLYVRAGGAWVDATSQGSTADVDSDESSSTDSQIALFSGTGGKTIKAATTTGILKAASGVISSAVEGTDYVTASSTNTLTNKTIDANASGNAITNLETTDFASGVLVTDTALAGATNAQIASALAVKTYTDNVLSSNDAMVFKGSIDASTNPSYPAADAGDTYKISVAGKLGGAVGADVTEGDTAYCIVDGSSSGDHATVGGNWTIIQNNIDDATTIDKGYVELATTLETETKTDIYRAVTPASLVNFPIKKTFTVGDGTATSIACTHNLGTRDVTYSVREASGHAHVDCDATSTDDNTLTLGFGTAPAVDALLVTVIG